MVRPFLPPFAAAVALALAAANARAQQPVAAPPPGGAGTIVGIVVDTSGRPLDGANVYIEARRRQITTGADGVFRFDGIGSDSVTVATRRIGFYPQAKRVKSGTAGASVVLELVPRIATLPASIVEATQAGLRGVVSDTSLVALPNAFVQVLGSGAGNTRTDSAGSFFVNAKPGNYMLRITRDGFQAQMIGVTVPERGGRRVAVRLTPGVSPYHAREAFFADALRDRLVRRSSVWSRVFTREDITRLNIADVSALARIGATARVDSDCMASIGGTTIAVPLWAIDPDEIDFMEVYARMPNTGSATINPRGVTSIGGSAPVRTQQRTPRSSITGPSGPCSASVIVWTRK